MQVKDNFLNLSLSFLFICCVIFSPDISHGFEPWTAEVTANVNLRKTPGLDGEVITGLLKNDIVTIKEKNGDWYQILLEKKTYGYKGWVYGQYLNKIEIEEEKGKTKNPLEREIDRTFIEESLIEKVTENPPHNQYDKHDKKEEKPELPTGTGEIKPTEIKPTEIKPTEIKPTEIKKDAPFLENEKPDTVLVNNEADPSLLKIRSEDQLEKNNEKITEPVDISQEQGVININKDFAAKKELSKSQDAFLNQTKNYISYQDIKEFFQLLLRLSTVLLSCIAIFFSYRALQLAKKANDKQDAPQNPL